MTALHVIAQAGIAVAHYVIFTALLILASRSKRLSFSWMFVLFAAFIFACGTTHLLNIVTLWHPLDGLESIVSALTAAVSLVTAVLLWPIVGRVVSLRPPEELEGANERLEAEIAQRRLAEEEARAVATDLGRRMEERTEELRRSNEQIETLAYVASHDLQEPLRMVASYTQLLQVLYKGKLDAEADQYIDRAVEGTVRMQALIDAFLAYARVDQRTAGFRFTPAEQAISLARLNLSVAIAESNAEITSEPLPVVHADLVQLVQVFQNLVSNAIKYRGSDAPRIHVSAWREGDEWIFSVRDQGEGVDPRHAERVFGMFRKLHGSGHPGTGMGLAICKRIVERHGGRIWVETPTGKGADFRFTLPWRDPAGAPAPAAPPLPDRAADAI